MAAAPPAPTPAEPKPVDYVCSMCGGNSVTRDAWAEWDAAAQQWTLGAAFDYAFCHDCEEETNLVEADLATGEPAAP
jgi:hypothetical protein